MTDERRSKVSSLRQLPQEIPPARDLWPQLEAKLKATSRPSDAHTMRRALWPRLGSLAALLATLGVGIWLGHRLLPVGTSGLIGRTTPGASRAAYLEDPRYLQVRAALLKSLSSDLQRLPPDTRVKVATSLATIDRSLRDIQSALGRDPDNALLQESLIDTYQDEMRVLTAVEQAGGANQEI